ncbi:MAG: hypothetical protein ACUVRP_12240 [Chlorobiales bacterium]
MKAIIFLLVAVLFAGCSASVVTTTTTYPMNHFQTGKTIQKSGLRSCRSSAMRLSERVSPRIFDSVKISQREPVHRRAD